jgi:eukaryotic-like serine/threonine-protein kinase
MGTPNYMSPEQCRGGMVDGRSDLFSAGATLFEMVTGERAFPGHNVGEVSHRIQNERLPLLPAPVRAVAPRLQFVLERAMEKQPEDRFHTGEEMAEALRQVLGGSRDDEGNVITRISPAGGVAGGTADSQKVRRDAGAQAREAQLDADTLQALEHKLTGYVGPIARILVRTTAGRSRSVGDLCSQLALSITDSAEREQFRREVELLLRSRSPVAAGTSQRSDSNVRSARLPEQELERVQEALTQFVGPIARVLVRRATADASSVEALWLSLSNHIESPAERSAFLRQRQK